MTYYCGFVLVGHDGGEGQEEICGVAVGQMVYLLFGLGTQLVVVGLVQSRVDYVLDLLHLLMIIDLKR